MSSIITRSKTKTTSQRKGSKTKKNTNEKKTILKKRKTLPRSNENSSENQEEEELLDDRRGQRRDERDEDMIVSEDNQNSNNGSENGNKRDHQLEISSSSGNSREDVDILGDIREAQRRSLEDQRRIDNNNVIPYPFRNNGILRDKSTILKKTQEVKNNQNLRRFDGSHVKSWISNFSNMTDMLPEYFRQEILYEKLDDKIRQLFDEQFIDGLHCYEIKMQIDWLLSTCHAEKTATQIHVEAQALIWKADTTPFIEFYHNFLLATPVQYGFNDVSRKILLHTKLPNLLQVLSNEIVSKGTLFQFVEWIKANEHLKLHVPILTGTAPVNAVASVSNSSIERLEVHDVNAIGQTKDRLDRTGTRGKPVFIDKNNRRWCSNCRKSTHWTDNCWYLEKNNDRPPHKFRRGNNGQRHRFDRPHDYTYNNYRKDPRKNDTREKSRKIPKKEDRSPESSIVEVTHNKKRLETSDVSLPNILDVDIPYIVANIQLPVASSQESPVPYKSMVIA